MCPYMYNQVCRFYFKRVCESLPISIIFQPLNKNMRFIMSSGLLRKEFNKIVLTNLPEQHLC